jgi:hypothetical protein
VTTWFVVVPAFTVTSYFFGATSFTVISAICDYLGNFEDFFIDAILNLNKQSSRDTTTQGRTALHDSTDSPSIQIRLGIRNRIYELEY